MDLSALLAAPARGPLVALAAPAPLASPEAFLRLPLPGDPVLWDARAWGEPWALAGRGAAAVVEGRGEGRFAQVRRDGQALLSRLDVRLAPGVAAAEPRLVGGASFEVKASSDGVIPWGPFGDARFVLPRWAYERGEGAGRLWLVLGADELSAASTWIERMQGALGALAQACGRGEGERPQPRQRPGGQGSEGDSERGYVGAVEAALGAIEQRRLEKVVVARAVQAELPEGFDPWAAIGAFEGPLARFALGRGELLFLGATPERLVELDGRGVRSEAVAGTSRGDEPEAVARLLDSTKDRREHEPVVEAVLSALRPHCAEVQAEPLSLRSLRHLAHLVTRVRGVAWGGTHVLDLVEALHPTPAVGGMPRGEAARWLREREGLERGWYAGPVGWFDERGSGQFAVALRSALVGPGRAWLFAGAGVVAGSEPEAELRETSVKLRAMREALGVAS